MYEFTCRKCKKMPGFFISAFWLRNQYRHSVPNISDFVSSISFWLSNQDGFLFLKHSFGCWNVAVSSILKLIDQFSTIDVRYGLSYGYGFDFWKLLIHPLSPLRFSAYYNTWFYFLLFIYFTKFYSDFSLCTCHFWFCKHSF